ncbi:MAG: GNAT family N-acetyltransferase [Candidatus Brocadia sp.]|jgi:hypothetical protein
MIIKGKDSVYQHGLQWEHEPISNKENATVNNLFGNATILNVWFEHWSAQEDVLAVAPDTTGIIDSQLAGSTDTVGLFFLPLVLHIFGKGLLRVCVLPTNMFQWHDVTLVKGSEDHCGKEAAHALMEYPHWDLLYFEHLESTRIFWNAFAHELQTGGYNVFTDSTMKVGLINLGKDKDIAAYLAALKGDFRRDLKRKLKQLESKHGPFRIFIVENGTEIDTVLRRGFELESKGWKGRAGTSVIQNPNAYRYYTSLAYAAAKQNALALMTFFCANNLVSFCYFLKRNNELILMKTAYNEDYRRYSVGQLAILKAIEYCYSAGILKLNFYGIKATWHTRWNPQYKQYARLVVSKQRILPVLALLSLKARSRLKKLPFISSIKKRLLR